MTGKKGKLHAFQADMTKENDILDAFKWTKENIGPVQILVNNAGAIMPTTLINGNADLWKKSFELNVLGACIATREALGHMLNDDLCGHIVHINSYASQTHLNFPGTNVYGATKHALKSVAESLRFELNGIGSKIRVSVSRIVVKYWVICKSTVCQILECYVPQGTVLGPVLLHCA